MYKDMANTQWNITQPLEKDENECCWCTGKTQTSCQAKITAEKKQISFDITICEILKKKRQGIYSTKQK